MTAVLIPCYNEALTIAKVVTDFRQALPEATIYVYDNHSTDNTAEEARRAGAVVRHEFRRGKGQVVRSMLRDIDADCYLLVDGDDTYPAAAAATLCSAVRDEGYDMVIGDRLSTSYDAENKRPLHGFGNRLVRSLVNRLFHSSIHDVMTGYRALSRNIAKNLPLLSNGFEMETELTIHALEYGFKIKEVPIDYRDRPSGSESKLHTLTDGFKVLGMIVHLFRDYRPYPFFTAIAAVWALVALVMFLPVLADYLRTGLVPRFPTLIVSGFLGQLSLLFYVSGILLSVLKKQHRQNIELWLKR